MNHSYKTCRNHESLFLKLGNHESLYFGSGIMNNESLRKAQQNRRMNYGMQDMAFPRVQISIFLGGGREHAPGSPIQFVRSSDSPLVSPVTLVLKVQ